jgi:hypothetical protein
MEGRKRCGKKRAEEDRRTRKKGIIIYCGEEDGTASPTILPWPFTCSFWSPLTPEEDGVMRMLHRYCLITVALGL